jgi:FAD-dependent oxidoreductase domain-containing protein 1
VLIVGGGAIGAAIAYFLRLRDPSVSVTVIERDPTYELASTPRGRRPAAVLPAREHRAVQVQHRFFADFSTTMAIDATPADIGFQRNGYLFIVPPDALGMLRRNYETQASLGCKVVWLEPAAVKQRFPSMFVDDLGAAVLSPDDGWLDPYAVLMGFRHKARSLGAAFIADEVVGLHRHGKRVTAAQLASGPVVSVEHVVNAAGAWAEEICAMVDVDVPIEPLRRYEHYFECQDPIEPLPYLKDTQRLAFRPEGTGYSGGVPTLADRRGVNFAVDTTYFENVVWPALAHRFPQFERTKCLRTLPGLYDQNDLDGNVIIGPVAGLGNFHLLAGFSGHGLMHAPGCGRAMAELILTGGYETIDLTRFGWQRIADGAPLPEKGII